MNYRRGFTVIEVVVVLVFVIVAAILFYTQQAAIEAASRDTMRKTAINAIYYNLEEVFYEKTGYYPQQIDSKTLRAMDPELFTDPNGYKLGDTKSDYQYTSLECSLDGKCKSYRLSTELEREPEYVKESRRD